MLAYVSSARGAEFVQIRVAPDAKVAPAEPAAANKQSQPADPTVSMLYLSDGDYFAGKLQDSTQPNFLRWLADGTTSPFEFTAESIRSAYFAAPQKRMEPVGGYCIELTDGDVLYGNLAAMTKDAAEIDSNHFGHLKIDRAEIKRLSPTDSAGFIYRGPNNLGEWTSDKIDQWREEAGRIVTSQRHAAIKKGVAIPEQAHIEFEISWTKAPQFRLAFCSSDKPAQLKEGFALEVWGKKLVLVRELSKTADVATVMDLDPNVDRAHLEALYNYPTGEFAIQALDGRELAKITLPKNGGYPLRIVSLTNTGNDLALEQLNISRWNGRSRQKVDVNKSRVHKSDGTIIYGDVVGYEVDKKQFVVSADNAEARVDCAEVICIVQTSAAKTPPSGFRIGLHDGSRYTGPLVKVEGEKLFLQRRGIDQPLACTTSDVRSLVGLAREARPAVYSKERVGRWESAGIRSHGYLIVATPNSNANATCLVWKPRGSAAGSPLRADVAGRIVYRDPPPKPKTNEQQTEERQRGRRAGVFWGAVTRVFDNSVPAHQPQLSRGAGTLCLLTGDRIPCESIQIDDEGVHFTSSVVSADFVPHKGIKALEFVPKWTAAALAEVKRTRLLTLPRMQKPNPPTHLVVSTAGDFLRCRLNSMNADVVDVEARLEPKKLARPRVACIIWLHDLDNPKEAVDALDKPAIGFQVQAVQSNENRLTFTPQECDGTTLSGKSDYLGACQVRLNAVDQLILGPAIRDAAKELMYGSWKLTDAVEPDFARDTAGTGQPSAGGSESALVGKPAPDFQLDLAAGGKFKISEQKGKIVILDFWASWCGPCMQSLPEVEKLAAEFKDRGVRLVAVNMQEDKATAAAAMERLKIQPEVALDVDGAASERYEVSAIPQTVVIDTESKVAALFIGGGPDTFEQLRATLQKAVEQKKDDKPAK
jgi:thiol-disulfide isomerase/thioredoxin